MIVKKKWSELGSGWKVMIELLGTIAVTLLMLAWYHYSIPPGIRDQNEFINWIGIIGFVVGFWGFIKSWQAASKSEKIEQKLIETGQISTEIKEDFQNIYDDHLISQLNKFKGNKGIIYLSLSTPAYGYSALTIDDSKRLLKTFYDLNHDHEIQLILFTPDAHYNYWTNTLFWALKKGSETLQNDFLNKFADHTLEFIEMFNTKKCQIWLKNETTVRFFGYHISEFSKKGYLSLVDNFTIYQDQSEGNFNARSLPIQSAHASEYFESDKSFFSKLKRCPYTLVESNKASLKLGNIDNIRDQQIAVKLAWDYILGRTSFKYYYAIEEFKDECELFHKNFFDKKEYVTPIADVLREILKLYFNYIISLDKSYQIINSQIISRSHVNKIKDVINKVQSNEFDSIKSYFAIATSTIDSPVDDFEELLFEAISSGFQESVYVSLIKTRNRA